MLTGAVYIGLALLDIPTEIILLGTADIVETLPPLAKNILYIALADAPILPHTFIMYVPAPTDQYVLLFEVDNAIVLPTGVPANANCCSDDEFEGTDHDPET